MLIKIVECVAIILFAFVDEKSRFSKPVHHNNLFHQKKLYYLHKMILKYFKLLIEESQTDNLYLYGL